MRIPIRIPEWETNTDPDGGVNCALLLQFNNLVVDKNTGRVYIGAVNKLYQLSPNLELTVRGESNLVNKLYQLSPNLDLTVRGESNLVNKLYQLSPNLELTVRGESNSWL